MNVRNDCAAFFQIRQGADGFCFFKRNNDISFAFTDVGRVNLFAVFDLGGYAAAALAHAVDFAHFYVIALLYEANAQNFGNQDCTLTANAN